MKLILLGMIVASCGGLCITMMMRCATAGTNPQQEIMFDAIVQKVDEKNMTIENSLILTTNNNHHPKITVIAMLFAGRINHLEILFPYLQSNLNNQDLSLVWVCVNTPDPLDRGFLRGWSQAHPLQWELFFITNMTDSTMQKQGYKQCFRQFYDKFVNAASEEEIVFLKLDDDIAYISPGAIQSMARTLMERRPKNKCLYVSAQVVNHPRLSFHAQKNGAILNFQASSNNNTNKAHPWKLRPNSSRVRIYEDDPFGRCSWSRGDCAANVHESFLYRQKQGSLQLFDFPFVDLHANNKYRRWSINMLAFKMNDIAVYDWNDMDDELQLSSKIPRKLNIHCCVAEHSVVVHFSYFKQRSFLLERTSLLERYKNLAYQLNVL